MIYFARAGNDGLVKIGYATNTARRLAMLQTGCPAPLTLLREIEGNRAAEAWLHRRFASLRRSGEWFEFAADMLTVEPEMVPTTICSFQDVIATWPAIGVLAADAGVPLGTVKQWRNRNRIPSDYWWRIAGSAERRGIHGVNLYVFGRLADEAA